MTLKTIPTAHFLRYKLMLSPLCPIHVGSGETIEPYEYLLLEEKDKKAVLAALDLTKLLSGFTEKQHNQFYARIDDQDFPKLRKWLRKQSDEAEHIRYRINVPPQTYKSLVRHIDNPERLGEIHLMPRNTNNHEVYIPGSSIKGAVRTALLDVLAQSPDKKDTLIEIVKGAESRNRQDRIRAASKFEEAVLENTDQQGRQTLLRDPFRQLAVSDVPVGTSDTFIEQVQIMRQQGDNRRDTQGILIYREMTNARVISQERTFLSELRMFPELTNQPLMNGDGGKGPRHLPHRLDVHTLCQACNTFYQPRLQGELQRFPVPTEVRERLQQAVKSIGENECLLRLGRHSHFECVTVSSPFHKSKKGFGKSRTYAGGKLPLGWSILKLMPFE